mgnify:CR=1 FL=1
MKQLPFDREKLEQIAAVYPTPFHIYDEEGIKKCVKELYEAFSWNKGFREYFAVKALPNPFILSLLSSLGCGCDCASLPELMLSDASGVNGERIMFSSNDTPLNEYECANALGAVINLDDISHIEMLDRLEHFPKTVCCRYNPGGDFKIGNEIMGNPGDAKYGFTYAQLQEGLKRLKELGAKRFGLHAFLSSNNTDDNYYPALAKILFTCGRDLAAETGLELAFINLSGGIGIPYRPDQPATDVLAVGEGVRKVYEEIFPNGGVALKTELGRWMTGNMGWLVTRVIHEKHTYKDYIGVDACAANLMRPAMYGAYHHITVCGKESLPHDHIYDVVGSLCENNDKFAIDRALPEIKIGDLLVIHDTGAHGHAMGYNYNGRLRSAEVLYTQDGDYRLIRRAETAQDYFATLDMDECAAKLGLTPKK